MVLDQINERIYNEIKKYHNHSSFVQIATKVYIITKIMHKIINLIACPADDKADTNKKKCFYCVCFGQLEFFRWNIISTNIDIQTFS